MQHSLVILCLAIAGASALQACTSTTECHCPQFPPGMKAFCIQQTCHCHTGSACTTAADCTTCHHGDTATCVQDAPGSAFCYCNGHEAPPQTQKCTTAETCPDCPNTGLHKACHGGECHCHFENECESPSDCYTCPASTQSVTCEESDCHCDGHEAPPKAPTCSSVSDCPRCPNINMTQACLNNECNCHIPGECKVASDCKTCHPDVTSVTCDGDGTGDMYCLCDGHPAPIHPMHHEGRGGFHGFLRGN
ncbi:multiple epidermal growth factor-like domains protein 9 [Pecten maximus]|uniref:multiple epidermal growth factor-like domains protein 9 n=1 Tax=Pecten maximus TaxID=6579 RepID=UPI0014588643|nr:multiple epidermal growth factor-like domains protein 9 [Pecten maximus]